MLKEITMQFSILFVVVVFTAISLFLFHLSTIRESKVIIITFGLLMYGALLVLSLYYYFTLFRQ
ncbi:hypothetical protein [Enterococcus rivorum]|uniref:Uncharacterized protein n=1 Tax=Enterococcus rivorum TaxID=762845 RepID=A0A1E5L0F5_9ENTE|nr:hypothetical protein [Enterococcus rivorum]MBP2098821.1 magnesium-transporting ATPase (P-type) [Enterococcus rivorum]OEH83554.1 hypothetical protein BCR26_08725 [Enterococcus rivorum]